MNYAPMWSAPDAEGRPAVLEPMPPEMPDDELISWAQGYLAGLDRGEQRPPADDDDYAAIVRAGFRVSERAARSKIWRAMVLAGETPTDDEIERRLWALTQTPTSGI